MGTTLSQTRFILLKLFHKTQFWLHASGYIDKIGWMTTGYMMKPDKEIICLNDLVSTGTSDIKTPFILLKLFHKTQFGLHASGYIEKIG